MIFKIRSLGAPLHPYNCGKMVMTAESYRESSGSIHATTQPDHNIFSCILATKIDTPLILNISQNSNYSPVHQKLPKQL